MRNPVLFAVFFVAVLLLAVQAAAADTIEVVQATPAAPNAGKLVTALDPDVVLNIAKGYGSAILTKDKIGAPRIDGKINGISYLVHFYGCANGANCESIQIGAAWSKNVKAVSLDEANAWNTKRRYAHCFVSKDGGVILQMDLMLRHGMTEKNLDANFSLWRSLIEAFKKKC